MHHLVGATRLISHKIPLKAFRIRSHSDRFNLVPPRQIYSNIEQTFVYTYIWMNTRIQTLHYNTCCMYVCAIYELNMYCIEAESETTGKTRKNHIWNFTKKVSKLKNISLVSSFIIYFPGQFVIKDLKFFSVIYQELHVGQFIKKDMR